MRYLLAWVLYSMGDLVTRRALLWVHGYRYYNWLMIKSEMVQGDGPGPWKNPPEEYDPLDSMDEEHFNC